MIKKLLRRVLLETGYEITRKTDDQLLEQKADLELYKKLFSEDSIKHKRFYNVGSGTFFHPLWTNLDYMSDWYEDVQSNFVHIDLMQKGPLPIDHNTAEIIYSSHTIEHIKDDAVQVFFTEAYKCLKPGGIFRITTGPDADTDYEAMMRGDTDWFYWDKWYENIGTFEKTYHKPATSVSIEERWLHHVASQLSSNSKTPSAIKLSKEQLRELINNYPKESLLDHLSSLCEFNSEFTGNHVSWWNFEKISSMMGKSGFSNIYRSGYGQSHSPVLRNIKYFDNTHPQISVYVEAVK